MNKPSRLPLDKFIKNSRDLFKKLNSRERLVVVLLGVVVLTSAYVNFIYKPQQSRINVLRSQLRSLRSKILALNAQMPSVRQEKTSLDTEMQSLVEAKRKLSVLEAGLPTQTKIPALLGELVNLADEFNIDFVSIKPQAIKSEGGYSTLSIEMKFNSGFSDLVNYLHRLENIEQFLNTASIKMEKLKDNFDANANSTLVLSTYLGESASLTQDLGRIKELPKVELAKDPFTTPALAAAARTAESDLALSGIIWKGPQPTAIINDKVVKAGDEINGFIIKEIVENFVVLHKGQLKRVLMLEQ